MIAVGVGVDEHIDVGRRRDRFAHGVQHFLCELEVEECVDHHPHSLIGLENLTDIREGTQRKKGKKVSRKQRKALLHSSMAIKVDAHYTSKACPVCGHTCDANRPNKGLLFICQNCHYMLHADLVGARNITMRTLLIRQDWVRTGHLSVAPDASDEEAKAARLRRYAELRWSLDASPRLLGMG